MTIDFNRSNPSGDRFKIRVIHGWRTVRQEQFSYDEVFQHVKDLTGVFPGPGGSYGYATSRPTTGPCTEATTEPTTQERKLEAEVQRRIDKIMAATQPANVNQK
jgi:hypothetical protein